MAKIVDGDLIATGIKDIKKGRLIIPEGVNTISGFFEAFISNDSYSFQQRVKSVTIPESIIMIGEAAFSHCELTSLIIPKNLLSIGPIAFSHNNISTITIKNSEMFIADSAFANNPIKKINVIINNKIVVLKEKDLLKIMNKEFNYIDGTLIVKLARIKQILENNKNAYDKVSKKNCASVFEALETLEVVELITKADISTVSKPRTKELKQPIRYNFGHKIIN